MKKSITPIKLAKTFDDIQTAKKGPNTASAIRDSFIGISEN